MEQFGLGERVVVIDRVDEQSSVPSVTVDNRHGIELAFRSSAFARPSPDRLCLRHLGRAHRPASAWTPTETLAEDDPIVLDDVTQTPKRATRAAAQLLAMSDRPTAIIAANDMTAFGVISALTAQGLRVPTDVSVVGFDGLIMGARYNPALTTVRQPIADMGHIAIDLAEKKAANGSVDHVVLTPELLVRASTAEPPA